MFIIKLCIYEFLMNNFMVFSVIKLKLKKQSKFVKAIKQFRRKRPMYLALYRKYRPVSFDDVISQEHITTTLKNQIESGQIAHAYLFTGTRGTGKTSCAKIMARAVNCLSPVNGNPCGKCAACKAIGEGSTDIIEIDAASNNGVDSIRQIRDEVIYTPIDCKYKVYIIDEVHMLSGAAFNALLKTLEEPPAHVIFILATTEYYKVPATILSRCQQFLFSKIDPSESSKRLLEIAEKENIKLSPEAAALIARLSDGAMRDALSLLDQCISTGRDINENTVRECSGAADSSYLFSVSDAAIEKDPSKALGILEELVEKGKDLSRFIEELTAHYHSLMLVKSGGEKFVKASESDIKHYREQCEKYSLDEIMYHIDLISDSLDLINRMKQTGQARLLTEQLLIRLATPKLNRDVSSFSARLGAVEQRLENMQKGLIPIAAARENPDGKSEAVEKNISSKSESKTDKKAVTANAENSKNKTEPINAETNKTERANSETSKNNEETINAVTSKSKREAAAPMPTANSDKSIQINTEKKSVPAAKADSGYDYGENWEMPPLPDVVPPKGYGGSGRTLSADLEEASAESYVNGAGDWSLPPVPDIPDNIPPENFGGAGDWNIPPEDLGGRGNRNIPPESSTPTVNKKSPKAEDKSVNAPPTRETAEKNYNSASQEAAEENSSKGNSQEAAEKKTKDKPLTEKAEKSSRPKTDSVINTAIGETDFDLPDSASPLPQWSEIISCLTPAARGVLTGSSAYLYDGKIYIKAGDAAATQLKRAAVGARLRDAVTNVMGGRFEIYMLREKPKKEEEKEDKVTPFLDRASALGIKVNITQK